MEIKENKANNEVTLEINIGKVKELSEKGIMYKVKMLQYNSVANVANPVLSELDGRLKIKYNLSGYISLNNYLSKTKMDGKRFDLLIKHLYSNVLIYVV